MIDKLVLLKTFGSSTASLLSVTAIATPTVFALSKSKNDETEINPKRAFNAEEEDGLDYNTDNKKEPFSACDGSKSLYVLGNLFNAKEDKGNQSNYHALDWTDLDLSSPEPLAHWLQQVLNFLNDSQSNHKVQVCTSEQSSVSDRYSYDFSSKQENTFKVDWATSQFGFMTQSMLNQFSYWESDANILLPVFIVNDITSPTKQIVWRTLTGSDFYTNWKDENDNNTKHFPHDLNFNLSGTVSTKDMSTWSKESETETTPKTVVGYKLGFDFKSEYTDTESNSSNEETETTWDKLSSLVDIQAKSDGSSSSTKLILPQNYEDFRFFAFDSDTPITHSIRSDGEKMFKKLVPLHGFTDSDDTALFNKLDLPQFNLVNTIDTSSSLYDFGNPYSVFIPSVKSNQNANINNQIYIELPDSTGEIKIPESYKTGYINFTDYYDMNSNSGISCDIDIDRNNKMVYTFKSGNTKVKEIEATISNSYREFLNSCLSSETSISSSEAYHTTGLELAQDREKQKDSYCEVRSSGDNNIINFHTNIAGSSSASAGVPFNQEIYSADEPVTQSAQSMGIGMSTSNDETKPINNDRDKTDSNYALNFAFVSNKSDIIATTTGSNNNMLCNLDYLLAINPNTTEFYDKSTSKQDTIKISLNPYYIQAAANAYSSYNFWLRFYANHDWSKFTKIKNKVIPQALFRDLIMRGFIKTETQANALFNILLDKQITALVPAKWATLYNSMSTSSVPYISSYCKLKNPDNNEYTYEPSNDFNWDYSSFTTTAPDIWPDEEGNIQSGRVTVSQSTWAPFCWKYGISPSTFSFLQCIPKDYQIIIPYGVIRPNSSFDSGSISGISDEDKGIVTKTWDELLTGEAFEFTIDRSDDWNTYSVVFGLNNTLDSSKQGIHGVSNSSKTILTDKGESIYVSLPDLGNIKLATINNGNHVNATGTGFNFNPIQYFSKYDNRSTAIKDENKINYIMPNATHNCIALNKADATLDLSEDNGLSNNTYVVSKVNATKIDYETYSDKYIQIDTDGTMGILLNFSNWRDTLHDIYENKKYYSSKYASSISGTRDDAQTWLMSGVAPEDWFYNTYLTTYDDYETYAWAFHPTGLWGYNMQFQQDLDDQEDSTWDQKHYDYGLNYSLWGEPEIIELTSNDYIPQEFKTKWNSEWQAAGYTKVPVYYTNNNTHELSFKVLYNGLKFYSTELDKTITPIQYIHYHDCFYNFGLTSLNSATSRSISDFKKTDKQYGDLTPTNFDHWNVDTQAETEEEQNFSVPQVNNLLTPNEIINFYKSTNSNGFYRCNVSYFDFAQLIKNGWIYIEPVSFNNSGHELTFKIHYSPDILYADTTTKLSEKNPDYIIQEYNQQNIKIPDMTKLTDWITTDEMTIKDFRCVGTEWSTVDSGSSMTALVIGLIVLCCVTPILIGLSIFGLHRIRTKYKRIK